MRTLVIAAVGGLLLSACGEKLDSVCSKSGGQCCKVSYGDSGNGSYSSSVFTCRPSGQSCLELANKYGGTPDFPHSIDIGTERDKCEAKIKLVPFWQSFQSFVIQVVQYTGNESVQRDDGSVASSSNHDYCKIACLTGHPGICPTLSIPNDTSLGLLTTFVDLAEQVTDQPKITPVRDVLANFALGDEANGCKRGDIVSSTTSIVNSASELCRVEEIPTSTTTKIDSSLSLPQVILGKPLPTEKTVVWEDKATALELTVNDAVLSMRYSGPVIAASRIDHDGIAAKVQGKSDVGCAELVGNISKHLDVRAAAKVIEGHPDVVKLAMKSFSEYRAHLTTILPTADQDHLNSLSVVAKLFPNSEYIDQVNQIARSKGVEEYSGSEKIGSSHDISSSDIITMIDIQLCSDTNASRSASELVVLVPKANSQNDISKLSAEREKIAGQIIQCKYSSQKIPPNVKDILRAYTKN
ncbi:hypothetical protein ACC705_02715 [Rhizobium ruizarguesonis]